MRVIAAAIVVLNVVSAGPTEPARAGPKPRPCQFEVVVKRGGKRLERPMKAVRKAVRRSWGKPVTWRLKGREIGRPGRTFRHALRVAERRGSGARLTRDLWGKRTTWRVRARSWNRASPHRVARLIRCMAPKFGVGPAKSLAVGSCESGLRWDAANGTSSARGVFQHLRPYWPGRAATVGLAGAPIFDVYAQVLVTHHMVKNGGWGPWECA